MPRPSPDAPMNTEARRLRAFAVDAAARSLVGLYSSETKATRIIELADRLYQYIETGRPSPSDSMPEVLGYSFRELLAGVRRDNGSPQQPVMLERHWDKELILTGFIKEGYVHACLHADGGQWMLIPGEYDREPDS